MMQVGTGRSRPGTEARRATPDPGSGTIITPTGGRARQTSPDGIESVCQRGRFEGKAMRALRVRYRIRLRFTVWRLLAAIACFGIVLALIHDAANAEQAGATPLAIAACLLAIALLSVVAIGGPILRIKQFSSDYRIRRKRERLWFPPAPDRAAAGGKTG
jgi:hypothetical protein